MTFKATIAMALVPVVRSYVRYFPVATGKQWILDNFAFRPRTATATTVFGATLSGSTTDLVHRSIYYFGVWEPHLTQWMIRQLRPGDVFIDVGANVGYFSMLAAGLVGPTGKVISIEASPTICSILRSNIAANGVTNIEVHNCAVAAETGTVTVFRASGENLGRTTILPGRTETALEAEVEAKPLGDIVSSDDLARARFIKIDVEGAEWGVIKGIEHYLQELAPDNLEVVVEVSPDDLRAQGVAPEAIFEVFAAGGFVPHELTNNNLVLRRSDAVIALPEELTMPLKRQTDVLFVRRGRLNN